MTHIPPPVPGYRVLQSVDLRGLTEETTSLLGELVRAGYNHGAYMDEHASTPHIDIVDTITLIHERLLRIEEQLQENDK